MKAPCHTQKPMLRSARHAKSVIGFDSLMRRRKSRICKRKAAFLSSVLPVMVDLTGEPQGSLVPHQSVNPVTVYHPFDSGQVGLNLTEEQHMAHITPMGLAPTLAVIDGQATTTSNDLARHFGKRHDHVLRDIENLRAHCPAIFTHPNFGASEYVDSTGRTLPAYRITRDGFTLLAMGFTGKRALAYIEAFNKMEAALRGDISLKPMTPPKPVRMLLGDVPTEPVDPWLHEAGYHGKLKPIKTLEDLLWLIEGNHHG